MCVAEGEDAHHVDEQAAEGDQHQSVRVDVWRRVHAGNRLQENAEGDDDKEDAVCKAAENLDAVVPKGECARRLPLGHDGGVEADHKGAAVEEHVEGIADHAQAVAPDAVHKLHQHEAEVDGEEDEDLARVAGLHDRAEQAAQAVAQRALLLRQGRAVQRQAVGRVSDGRGSRCRRRAGQHARAGREQEERKDGQQREALAATHVLHHNAAGKGSGHAHGRDGIRAERDSGHALGVEVDDKHQNRNGGQRGHPVKRHRGLVIDPPGHQRNRCQDRSCSRKDKGLPSGPMITVGRHRQASGHRMHLHAFCAVELAGENGAHAQARGEDSGPD
eukprot:m.110241 g.110241  ORF g.110241 m.110241 type:complete len:331 (+) comp9058_c0_seq5:2815-3807(+)